jgi:predicted RNA-binding protein (virulence factor B family)
MIELGKMQKLQVVKKDRFGLFLSSKNDQEQETVFLPLQQAPPKIETGNEIEVFVYTDSGEKMVASLNKPKLTRGELAGLKVVATTNFGAFLDWGLEKDLLLPVKEQVGPVQIGQICLVGLFLNRNQRLCATMKIYDLLQTGSPYKENDMARGTVYRLHRDLGAFVAVENQYHGLIPKQELFTSLAIGDSIQVRIKKVRQDGKLELSLRQEAYSQIEIDARFILETLKAKGGSLAVNDDSSPEQIKALLKMSKAAFKRAVGRLLKEGAIKLTAQGIEMRW